MAILFPSGNSSIRTTNNFAELPVSSICFWYNPSSVSGNNRILATDKAWEIRLSGNNLRHEIRQNIQPTTTTNYSVSSWFHVVVLTSNTQKGVYVNGVVDVPLANFAVGGVGTTNPLSVGASNQNANQGMFGQLEDLRIYNRILSPAEINLIANARGKDKICNGLSHWWLLASARASGQPVIEERNLMGGVPLNTVVGTPTYQNALNTYFKGGY